jgi:antitoxin PrlF
MTYSSTLTSKGQVTVPVSIRRRLGLKPGQPIRFRVTESNQVVIEKNDWKEGLKELQQEAAAHFKQHNIKPLSDEELDQAIDDAAMEAVTRKYPAPR